MRSVDITAAFTHGDLDETIYMRQPEGFHVGDPDDVCILDKALYGLKQAARQWNLKRHAALLEMGFQRLESDRSIYLYVRGEVRIIIPVYVDDITFVSKVESALDEVVLELSKYFKLRDLGPTRFLLGIQIERDWEKRSISLSQRQHIVDKLEQFGMANCNSVTTPMQPGTVLSLDMCPKTPEAALAVDKERYGSAVGALLYLATSTRPDISYAVGSLARFTANPGPAHDSALTHLFRYLQGTKELKLVYSASDPDSFVTFTDSDHGNGDKDGGKSTGGYMVRMGGAAVSWRSKLQPIVTLSTTEAEYVAAVEAGKEIKWMRNLMEEFGSPLSAALPLLCDNQSAISVAKNPDHHGRMKHLDLRFYWLRDEVERGSIAVSYIPTGENAADLLTKPLDKVKVQYLRPMYGLC
jgi:hypothetical protein